MSFSVIPVIPLFSFKIVWFYILQYDRINGLHRNEIYTTNSF